MKKVKSPKPRRRPGTSSTGPKVSWRSSKGRFIKKIEKVPRRPAEKK